MRPADDACPPDPAIGGSESGQQAWLLPHHSIQASRHDTGRRRRARHDVGSCNIAYLLAMCGQARMPADPATFSRAKHLQGQQQQSELICTAACRHNSTAAWADASTVRCASFTALCCNSDSCCSLVCIADCQFQIQSRRQHCWHCHHYSAARSTCPQITEMRHSAPHVFSRTRCSLPQHVVCACHRVPHSSGSPFLHHITAIWLARSEVCHRCSVQV